MSKPIIGHCQAAPTPAHPPVGPPPLPWPAKPKKPNVPVQSNRGAAR